MALAGGGVDRRQRRGEVPRDAVGQREQAAVRPPVGAPGAPAAGHLVGHPHRAAEAGVGVGVAGVEEIEALRLVVEPPHAVEGGGVAAAEDVEPPHDPRVDVRVHGVGRRREEVGRLRGHLVKIDVDLRLPAPHRLDPEARLALRAPRPVPVEVEAVVVGAAARPRLAVLGRGRIGVGEAAAALLVGGHVALPAVGIRHRVDQHHQVVERLGAGAAAGRQQVGRCQRRLGGGGLVAVDAVGQPDHGGQPVGETFALAGGERRGIGQQGAVAADLVEPRDVAGARHRDQGQRPVEVGGAVVPQRHAVGRRRQRGEVAADPLVAGEALPQGIAEDLAGRRHRRVGRRQLRVLPGGELGQQGDAVRVERRLRRRRPDRRQRQAEGHGRSRQLAQGRHRRPGGQEVTLSTEMLSRFIISWSVVGLTWSSSAARFCTPPAACRARMMSWRS